MAARELSEKWSPPWATHVEGRYEPESFDDGKRESQRVEITCAKCKGTFKTTCESGRVRQHIATFAQIHLHRSPLAAVPKTRSPR